MENRGRKWKKSVLRTTHTFSSCFLSRCTAVHMKVVMKILHSACRIWSNGSSSGRPSFWRTFPNICSTSAQFLGRYSKIVVDQIFCRWLAGQVSQLVSQCMCPCPDLRATLEKMRRCSRSNPSLLVPPVLEEPKFEQLPPAFAGLLQSGTRTRHRRKPIGSQSDQLVRRVAILQPRDHLLLAVSPASAASTWQEARPFACWNGCKN